jgi:hypothetical protein
MLLPGRNIESVPKARPLRGSMSYRKPRNDKIARTTTIAPISQMMLFMRILS